MASHISEYSNLSNNGYLLRLKRIIVSVGTNSLITQHIEICKTSPSVAAAKQEFTPTC